MESTLGLVRHSGNENLFAALEMSLLATLSGQPLHLHAEGLRGTGKTSIMRGMRRLLPRIRRVRGCLYNCDPAHPHCPAHRNLSLEDLSALGDEWVPMPFLEISHSAKVGTVVGSIDLGRLVNPAQPEAYLLPGTIPQAHRGILFVDEINRLAETAPELADVLLDVMGTKPGRVQIEETGLPAVELPVQVSVWAASNPDEDPGPLDGIRRQLSDRFDFVIYTDRPGDPAVVEAILASAAEPGWNRTHSPADEARVESFRTRLLTHLVNLHTTQVPPALRQQIADLYSRFQVESLRAVQALYGGARLSACLDQRKVVGLADLARVTPMALRHRVDPETMRKITQHLSEIGARREAEPTPVASVRQRLASVGLGAAHAQSSQAASRTAGPDDLTERLTGAGAAALRSALEAQGRTGDANTGRREAANPGTSKEANPTAAGKAGQSLPAGAGQAMTDLYGRTRDAQPGRMAGGEPQPSGHNWLSRTLSGLRRNLGRNGGGASGRQGSGSTGQGAAGGHKGAAGTGGSGSMQTADPLKTPRVAPPQIARPLAMLESTEFIRTEEELKRV